MQKRKSQIVACTLFLISSVFAIPYEITQNLNVVGQAKGVQLGDQIFKGNSRFADVMNNIGDVNDDGIDDIAFFIGKKQSHNCQLSINCTLEAYYPGIIVAMPDQNGNILPGKIYTIDANSIGSGGMALLDKSLESLFNRGLSYSYSFMPLIKKMAQDQNTFTLLFYLNGDMITLKLNKTGGLVGGNVFSLQGTQHSFQNLTDGGFIDIGNTVPVYGMTMLTSVDGDSYDDIITVKPDRPGLNDVDYNGRRIVHETDFMFRDGNQSFKKSYYQLKNAEILPKIEEFYIKTKDPLIYNMLYASTVLPNVHLGNLLENLGDLDGDGIDEIYNKPFVFSFAKGIKGPEIKSIRCLRFYGTNTCIDDPELENLKVTKLKDFNYDGLIEVAVTPWSPTLLGASYDFNIYTVKIAADNNYIDLIPYRTYSKSNGTLPTLADPNQVNPEFITSMIPWRNNILALTPNHFAGSADQGTPNATLYRTPSTKFANRLWKLEHQWVISSSVNNSSSSQQSSSSSSSSSKTYEIAYTDDVMRVEANNINGDAIGWTRHYGTSHFDSPRTSWFNSSHQFKVYGSPDVYWTGKTLLNAPLDSRNINFQFSMTLDDAYDCKDQYCGNVQVFFEGRGLHRYQVAQFELTDMMDGERVTKVFGLSDFVKDQLSSVAPYKDGELTIELQMYDPIGISFYVDQFQFNYDDSEPIAKTAQVDCTSIPLWGNNIWSYTAGTIVKKNGKTFQCLDFPSSGWCVSDAYEPDRASWNGSYVDFQVWSQAWKQIGTCN